jgi:hypothetical protein
VAALAFAALLTSAARAHGDAGPHRLGAADLCLDPSSVSVSLVGVPTPERNAAFLRSRLEEGLDAAVDRYDLPLERREVCPPDARLTLTLDARTPADGLIDYALALEVAAVQGSPRFVARLNARHDEGLASAPYLVQLPGYGAAMMNDLALSWWEDNPVSPPPRRRWLPPLLGGLLAAVVLLLGVRWARRRRGPQSDRQVSPYDGS